MTKRHTYIEQKRKVEALTILCDKAAQIVQLFMQEEMEAGNDPRANFHLGHIALALSPLEFHLKNWLAKLDPLVLIEDTPTPALVFPAVCGHEWGMREGDNERECVNCGEKKPHILPVQPDSSDDTFFFRPPEVPAYVKVKVSDLNTSPPARVVLDGTPNSEIADDDLPF